MSLAEFEENRLIWKDGDTSEPCFCGHCHRPLAQPPPSQQMVLWTHPNLRAVLCPPCQDLWREAADQSAASLASGGAAVSIT